MAALDEADAILDGRTRVPHWRLVAALGQTGQADEAQRSWPVRSNGLARGFDRGFWK